MNSLKGKNTKLKIFNIIFKLSNYLSKKRKKQLVLLFFVMVGSSISETFLLSSIIPFIGVLSKGNEIYKIDDITYKVGEITSKISNLYMKEVDPNYQGN